MRVASLLLLAALATGCQDYIINEPAPVQPTTPEAVPELPALTLKGPETVTRGEAPLYKAGAFDGAERYAFQLNSGPLVLASTDDDNDRYFYTEVAGEGRVEVRVTAYDSSGEAIAFARRWVESRF